MDGGSRTIEHESSELVTKYCLVGQKLQKTVIPVSLCVLLEECAACGVRGTRFTPSTGAGGQTKNTAPEGSLSWLERANE